MASSSTSSHSTLPTSWKYDVFLSFRGTDTRYNFVDHLYTALKQQGIGTFKDDKELPRGETINPTLLKAIEDSQIAVVVFSENYADSSWCLQELEHIMKCKVERGQIVIPIFYHVDPSEIRKQKRKYGEAFVKHESENKNVESWRKALTDAGNLAGHVPDRPETIFIKNIVEDIFEKLCVTISSDNENLVGMEDRVQDLKSKLAIDSEGVVMVGIWGLGGGGKTTLACALYDEISDKFDGCCFLKNVREESRKHGLEALQKEIFLRVLKQNKKEIFGDVRKLIKIRLRRKKVLLVLDDVDNANQLEALVGSRDWFNEGSRIIITTKDIHLLNICKIDEIYNIRLLNHDESMKLFRKYALQHDNRIEDYDSLSNEVVSYAHGLPLALKVMGLLLCDKDKGEWESTLARIKVIPEGDILEKLKVSYDGLDPIVKELFLEIACFFRTGEKVEAMVILDACDFYPKIGVRQLIQKALITVTKEGNFDMHDLIQEMGHYIVRGKNPRNPEKHSRVWLMEDVVKICASPTQENDWIEALQVSGHSSEKIEALQIRGPSWEEVPRNLPHVVASMKKLRWISCSWYPATSLPINIQSTDLFYLQLEFSWLEQLWEGTDKHLSNLKVLDVSNSINLIKTPNFKGLPCLEKIRLNFCEKLTYIDPSISDHERLISVEMEYCSNLKEFPPISGMKKLKTLLLSWCSELYMCPEIQMNMDNMEELSLKGTGIKVVPSSIGQYCTKLISLDLRRCTSLESIEGNFRLLEHLKEFYLDDCEELKIPPEGLFDVQSLLKVLDLSDTSFKNLHPDIVSMKFLGFPPSLRTLSLRSCNWINGDISSVLCELSNLQVLDLRANSFSRLHCSLLQLPSLKFLNLSNCYNLEELPDLPESIAILKADRCSTLKIVDLPTNLKWLWRISVPMESISGDVERKVKSMLQGNTIEDCSMSVCFYGNHMATRNFERRGLMLELPTNWYNEFSGFLLYIEVGRIIYGKNDVITIEDVMDIEENTDVLKVLDGTTPKGILDTVLYIPFGSLRHTSWLKSSHTTISFSMRRNICSKVELVSRRSNDESIEKIKDTTKSTNFWDKEPIEVIHDSKSCIEIKWRHDESMFHNFY